MVNVEETLAKSALDLQIPGAVLLSSHAGVVAPPPSSSHGHDQMDAGVGEGFARSPEGIGECC